MPDDQRARDGSTNSTPRGVLLVGEQQAWLFPVWAHLENNNALELAGRVPLNPHTDVQIGLYRLEPGRTATDLVLGRTASRRTRSPRMRSSTLRNDVEDARSLGPVRGNGNAPRLYVGVCPDSSRVPHLSQDEPWFLRAWVPHTRGRW